MALTEQDYEDRKRALEERVDGDRPESWQPHDPERGHPQRISGILVRVDPGHTVWGEQRIVILRDGDKDWAVWLFHQVLEQEFDRLAPQPGELVAVRYTGTVRREPPQKDYEGFRVEVDRAGTTIAWGADAKLAAAPVADVPPDPEPPGPPAREQVCGECGVADPDHSDTCSSSIPF